MVTVTRAKIDPTGRDNMEIPSFLLRWISLAISLGESPISMLCAPPPGRLHTLKHRTGRLPFFRLTGVFWWRRRALY